MVQLVCIPIYKLRENEHKKRTFLICNHINNNFFNIKHWRLNCSWSDKAPMSPKRILVVDLS